MVKITIDRSTGTSNPGKLTQRINQPGTTSPAGTSGGEKLRQTQENIGFAIADKQKKIVETNYLANSRINASKEVLDLKESLLNEMTDPVGYADKFSTGMDKIHADMLSKAPTDRSRASLMNVFAQQKIAGYEQAVHTEGKMLSEKVLSDASNNIDQLAINIFEEPSSFPNKLEDIDAIIESTSEVLSPIEQEKFQELAKKRLTDFYVKGLIDKNLTEAESFANSKAISDVFDPDEVLKYRDAIERKKIQVQQELVTQKNTEQEALALDRELGIFKGDTSQLQLDEDLEKGSYGIKEYLSLSNKLRVKESKDLKDTDSINRVNERQELGLPFDTTDLAVKKDLNIYFEKVVAPTITKDNQDSIVSTFVNKYSFIPDTLKSNLLAGLHNGSPAEVSRTSRLIDSLTSNDPQLARQFSDSNDLARASVITDSINAGMPEEDAVKAADNMLIQKNSIEQELRQKDFKEAKIKFDQDEITSFFVNDPNEVPAAMRSDWLLLTENYMLNLRVPLDTAKKNAYKIVSSEWGISDVTGTETYIKHAPEKYYNKPGIDPSWINKQLVEDIKSIDPELKDFNLTIDPDTIGKENPGYFVDYISEHGIPLKLRDEKGNLKVWRPDINFSKDVQNQIKRKEEAYKLLEIQRIEATEENASLKFEKDIKLLQQLGEEEFLKDK